MTEAILDFEFKGYFKGHSGKTKTVGACYNTEQCYSL